MKMEKHFQSKDGKRFLDIGYQSQTAVGSGDEKPSEVVPLQEGIRIMCINGVDRWATVFSAVHKVRKIVRAPFRLLKRKK